MKKFRMFVFFFVLVASNVVMGQSMYNRFGGQQGALSQRMGAPCGGYGNNGYYGGNSCGQVYQSNHCGGGVVQQIANLLFCNRCGGQYYQGSHCACGGYNAGYNGGGVFAPTLNLNFVGGTKYYSSLPAPYVDNQGQGQGSRNRIEQVSSSRPIYQSSDKNSNLNDAGWDYLRGLNAKGIEASNNWKNLQFQLSDNITLREKTTHYVPVNARQNLLDSILTFEGRSRLGLVARVDNQDSIPNWIFVEFSQTNQKLRLAFLYNPAKDLYELMVTQPTDQLGNKQDWIAPKGIYLMIATSQTTVDLAPSGNVHREFR